MVTSPSHMIPCFSKRKNGKLNPKKLESIEIKYQTLKVNLRPIPFAPSVILYFSKHQNLLRSLGLWDFANLHFHNTVSTHLLAQLVATYDSRTRISYVNGARIFVSKASLVRALNLPLNNLNASSAFMDHLQFTQDSIQFILSFVSHWMLLHHDNWIMPPQLSKWINLIKDGSPHKVDWPSLLWFMLHKELTQGDRLRDCYYASHLQYLIICQHPELVSADHPHRLVLDKKDKEGLVGVSDHACLQPDCTNLLKEDVHVGVLSKRVHLDEERNKADEVHVGVLTERVGLAESKNKAEEVDVGDVIEKVGLAEEKIKTEEVDVEVVTERVGLAEENNKPEEVDVGVVSERVGLAEEKNKPEGVDVGVVSERVDLVEEANKAEEVDVGIASERVDLVEEENKAEEVDVGIASERLDSVEEENKSEEVNVVEIESNTVVLVEEENKAEEVDVGIEFKTVNLVEETNKAEVDIQKVDVDVPERLNIELTVGEATGTEVEEEEKVHHVMVIDLEEGNANDANDDNPGQWHLDAENTISEHTLERCNMEIGNELSNYEDINEDAEDIEEAEDGAENAFDILENTPLGDGLLQTNKYSFSSHWQFGDQPGMGLLASRNNMPHANSAGPSFYGNGGKRALEDSLSGNNKRLRTDEPWSNEPPNFMMCMNGMQEFITRGTMMYEVKEQSLEQSNMNKQILLNELQKRDCVIEHLHKSISEEMQKKGVEIYRLEREVGVMGNLLHRYRTALKETQKEFAVYAKQFAAAEESIYKDAGPGGLTLTTEEVEKRRLKQQEDDILNCLMLEEKAKETEEDYARQFASLLDKVGKLDSRLAGLENQMIELKNSQRNCKDTSLEQPICSKTSRPA